MKVLAIGDIHTKLWIIDNVRKLIDDYDAVVFVGDYADDWKANPMASLQTWKHLRSLSHFFRPKVKLVTGNHDYIYAHKTPTKQSGYNYATQALIDAPGNGGLMEWLTNLPIIIKLDGVTYSHAGITVAYRKGHDWHRDSPLWARPGGRDYQDIPQVFGHTPSKTCWEVQPHVWCIDTFSTYPDGQHIGDCTALEIVDGKSFQPISLT